MFDVKEDIELEQGQHSSDVCDGMGVVRGKVFFLSVGIHSWKEK